MKKRILVMRFSAMGDVALLVPIVQSFLVKYPDYEVVIATKKLFCQIFNGIENVILVPYQKDHDGVMGLIRYQKELKQFGPFEAVIDLHDVIRTKFLRQFFRTKKSAINKGRTDKKKMIRRQNKERKILKHTTDRYYDVFQQLGYSFKINKGPWLQTKSKITFNDLGLEQNDETIWVGIAPFAKHKGKTWPWEKQVELVNKLLDHSKIKILFFGGPEDQDKIDSLIQERVYSMVGKVSLSDELFFISKMNVFLSMDSSNMHFAALLGVKVISIWGSTHPDIGFAPLGDNQGNMISVDVNELNCRPCSVFGNKPCFRGDYACLQQINMQQVYEKICLEVGLLLKKIE